MADQVGLTTTLRDPGNVGKQLLAPRPLLRLAAKLGLLKHGQSLRLQMRPCGWCLVYGGADHYITYPSGMNPRVWLTNLVPGRREFERQERRAGRALPPRLRVIHPKRLPCRRMRNPSRQARRVRVRSARKTRAGPTRPDDDPQPPDALRDLLRVVRPELPLEGIAA
jgi:hypothetical protein